MLAFAPFTKTWGSPGFGEATAPFWVGRGGGAPVSEGTPGSGVSPAAGGNAVPRTSMDGAVAVCAWAAGREAQKAAPPSKSQQAPRLRLPLINRMNNPFIIPKLSE